MAAVSWEERPGDYQMSMFRLNQKVWSDAFLHCIRYKMMPEITTFEQEVVNSETMDQPYWKYHVPIIHYINVNIVDGQWKRTAVYDTGVGPSADWRRSKKVYVTPSNYEFYGSEETAGGMSCGWHYDPMFHIDMSDSGDFEGFDVGGWNEFRPAGYQIHPFVYRHRYPAGFAPPRMTGERSGGGSYGVGTAGATPTLMRETGTVDASELKSEEAGYPKSSDVSATYETFDLDQDGEGEIKAEYKKGTEDGVEGISSTYRPPFLR